MPSGSNCTSKRDRPKKKSKLFEREVLEIVSAADIDRLASAVIVQDVNLATMSTQEKIHFFNLFKVDGRALKLIDAKPTRKSTRIAERALKTNKMYYSSVF